MKKETGKEEKKDEEEEGHCCPATRLTSTCAHAFVWACVCACVSTTHRVFDRVVHDDVVSSNRKPRTQRDHVAVPQRPGAAP